VSEPHSALNALDAGAARDALTRCCKSTRWVDEMLQRRPFDSTAVLYAKADAVWESLDREDYLEAFRGHPRIGASVEELAARFESTAGWSAGEQGAVKAADLATLEALRDGNAAYESRFGFIFIVCATGKTAREMLAMLHTRIGNQPDAELRIAAAEQGKITKLRLEKLAT
jgi:2-oxo-4-hydroxy-4-carboxy-5-ureidoimidazoline decarboxylase